MSNNFNHTNIFKKTKLWFLKIQKITRKKAKNIYLKKIMQNRLLRIFNNLSMSDKQVGDKKINNNQ